MKLSSPRSVNSIGFLLCLALLGTAYYFQFARGMIPCLLCHLQRWGFVLVAITLFFAILQNPRRVGVVVYGLITFIFASAGAAAAGRQVWLQHRPESAEAACLPGLQFLLQTRPLHEVLRLMMRGDSQCAKVAWHFLHLTMSEWTLVFFCLFMLLGLVQIVRGLIA